MEDKDDERFVHIFKDPRFRTVPKAEKKVKIDKRFSKMFTEKNFKLKYSMDKRGRKIDKVNSEDLSKFYDLSSDDDEAEEDKDERVKAFSRRKKVPDARGNELSDSSTDSSSSSSSSSEDEDSESEESEEFDHKWGELDRDAQDAKSITRRLAVCNLDWDRIKATDLFVLFASFKPADSTILSVRIYPSQFGKERMKVEKEKGPIELVSENCEQIENETSEEDEDDYSTPKSTEKLRQYQINRLKYYYAVVECDSAETANSLYQELDGMEYESSSTVFDLRFISDDTIFDETPSSECNSFPDRSKYKPPQFIATALQQSKVRLTWDETDPERKNKLQKAFNNLKDADDLEVYLASSSSEDDVNDSENEINKFEDGDKINKYKELLNNLETEENEKDVDIEITWNPDLQEMAEDVVERKEKEKHLSEFEADYLRKKEKRKTKRKGTNKEEEKQIEKDSKLRSSRDSKFTNADNQDKESPELDLLLMDTEHNKKHFNYRKVLENPKKDDFEFNADDPRFSSLFTSHHYSVDPSDPHFKHSKMFDEIVKRKKRKHLNEDKEKSCPQFNTTNNLKSLVNSVKSKANKKIKFK